MSSYYSVTGDSTTIFTEGTVTTAGIRTHDEASGCCRGCCVCFECLWACCLREDVEDDHEIDKMRRQDGEQKIEFDDGESASLVNLSSQKGQNGGFVLRLKSEDEVSEYLEYRRWKHDRELRSRSRSQPKSRKSPLRLRVGSNHSKSSARSSNVSRGSSPSLHENDTLSTAKPRDFNKQNVTTHHDDDSIPCDGSGEMGDHCNMGGSERISSNPKWSEKWKSRRSRSRFSRDARKLEKSNEHQKGKQRLEYSKSKEVGPHGLPPRLAKRTTAKAKRRRRSNRSLDASHHRDSEAESDQKDFKGPVEYSADAGGNMKQQNEDMFFMKGSTNAHASEKVRRDQVGGPRIKGILVNGNSKNNSQGGNQEGTATSASSSKPIRPQAKKEGDIDRIQKVKQCIGARIISNESHGLRQSAEDQSQEEEIFKTILKPQPRSPHAPSAVAINANSSGEKDSDPPTNASMDKDHLHFPSPERRLPNGTDTAKSDQNGLMDCEREIAKVPKGKQATKEIVLSSLRRQNIHGKNEEFSSSTGQWVRDDVNSQLLEGGSSRESDVLGEDSNIVANFHAGKKSGAYSKTSESRLNFKPGSSRSKAIFHRLSPGERPNKSDSSTLSINSSVGSSKVPNSITLVSNDESRASTSHERRGGALSHPIPLFTNRKKHVGAFSRPASVDHIGIWSTPKQSRSAQFLTPSSI